MLPIQKTTLANPPVSLESVTRENSLKYKIQRAGESLVNGFCFCPCMSAMHTRSWKRTAPHTLEQRIQAKIEQICEKESAFKEIVIPHISTPQKAEEIQAKSKVKRQEWLAAFHEAFQEALQGLNAAEMRAPPRKIALQLAEILGQYGIALYSSSDAPHPFESSLSILRAALIMEEYALGLRPESIDLSALQNLDTLHLNPSIASLYQHEADKIIAQMESKIWAEKVSCLSQQQLFNLALILRYINGAMRYLKKIELSQSEKMLYTVEACLMAALGRPAYDQVELRDQLAELKYNDLTGLLGLQIKEQQRNSQHARANQLKAQLATMWNECIELSKDPENMGARCDNKRTFVEEMQPLAIAELRLKALKRHLSIPPERRNRPLIALAWNNLSHALVQLGEEDAAYKAANMAMKYMLECRAKGIEDSQFNAVDRNYMERCKKFIERQERENKRLQAVDQA